MIKKIKDWFFDIFYHLFAPFISERRVALIKSKKERRRREELYRMLDESW